MTNNSKILLAFLAGGAIGAGVALLTAPTSGEETRKKIKESLDDAKSRITEKASELQRTFTDRKEGLKAAYTAGKDAYLSTAERVGEK
ncbi:MAG: hypothetical protein A3J24_08435 [Deltaproteobacteria bacterium RIFCSPLOWO2_02_FULL_53_8]|nr:MAG: hypothetical protein A3J24_08435 [Deltaproteobacteria bacterium RIFCSPLOWO2_02_FULL_53_8]